MEMQQVRYFVALAGSLNFTRAAEQCNVTQPVLTRAIKALEDELGGELIRREGRLSHLTELGQRMLPLLRQCLESALSAKSLAKAVANGETPSIAIGMSRTIDAALLVSALAEIYRVFPGIQLKLRRGTGSEIGQFLKNGDVEIAVAGPLGESWERLDCWPMFTESFDVLVSSAHELARRNEKELEMDSIRQEQLLLQTGSELANEEMDRFGANGIALGNAHQVETHSDLAAMLDANLGVAIVPSSALKSSRYARLNLPGFDLRRTVSIYAVAGRRRTPETTALLGLLRAADWSTAAA
jgi:DNA-binding transcriptional LysR family regulator